MQAAMPPRDRDPSAGNWPAPRVAGRDTCV